MLRKLKLIMLVITFLIVTGFGLALVFINTIDLNQYKPVLEKQASLAIGRNITIEGDLHWKLYPSFSVQVKGLHLSSEEGFKHKQYFSAKQIDINLDLMPLIQHNFVVKSLKLHDVTLKLETNKQGAHNWQPHKMDTNSKPTDINSKPTDSNTHTKVSNEAKGVDVSNIEIDKANILYQNDQMGITYQISDLSYKGKFKQQLLPTEKDKPFAIIRHLDLEGKLNLKRIDVNKVHFSDIEAKLKAHEGIFTFSANVHNLYQGQSNDDLRIDVRDGAPRLALTREVSGVQIQGLFDDLGYTNRIKGTMHGKLQLSANDISNIPASLNGHGSLNIDKGSLQGVNITHAVLVASAFFNRHGLPEQQGANETPFESMTGDVNIQQGVVHTENLSIKSPMLQVLGKGIIDLNAKQLDYRLRASTLGINDGDKLAKAQKFLDGGFPLRAKGSLSQYHIKPDYEALAKSAAKYFLQKEVGDKLEDIGKKLLKDGGDKSLKQLLKDNKDKLKGSDKKINQFLNDILN